MANSLSNQGARLAAMQQAALQHQIWLRQQAQNWQPAMSAQSAQNPFLGNNALLAALKPDPKQPGTLGWREWRWSDAVKMLMSPSQATPWPEAELVVPNWDEGAAVRGVSGIHAHLVPKNWKILGCLYGEYVPVGDPMRVHGISAMLSCFAWIWFAGPK